MNPGCPARYPALVLAILLFRMIQPCLCSEAPNPGYPSCKEKDTCSLQYGKTLFVQAGQYFTNAEFREAERAYQNALDCFRKIPSQDSLEALCLLGEAMALFRQDRLEEARLRYHDLLEFQEDKAVLSSDLEASVMHNLGLIYQQQFDFQRALEYQLKAAEFKESGGGSAGFKGSAWNNLGALHEQSARPAEALRCYEKAYRYFVSEGGHDKLMTINLNLARLRQAMGNHAEAAMYLDAAVLHARKAGNTDPGLRHELLYSLAVKHYQQAAYQAALSNCQEINSMRDNQPLQQRIREMSLMACCMEKLQRISEADSLFSIDFQIDADKGAELSALASHLMARALFQQHRKLSQAAIRNMQNAVDAFENAYGQSSGAVLYARMQLADLWYQQKNYRRAWQESRHALDQIQRHEDQYYPPLCIDIKELSALSAFALYEEQPDQISWLEESVQLYSCLARDLSRIRMGLADESGREGGKEYKLLLENGIKIGWMAWQEHLPGSLQHIQEMMQLNRALSLRRQWQERAFIESLPDTAVHPVLFREAERNLRQQQYRIELELAKSSPDFDQLAGMEERYLAALRMMDSLRAQLALHYPHFDTHLPDLAAKMHNFLTRDSATCLIEYFSGGDCYAALLHTAEGEDMILWNKDSAAVSTLQQFLADIRMISPDTWQQRSREACHIVMEPLMEYIREYRHLVIIPDAELWTLPFDALILPDGYVAAGKKEQFLIEKFSLELAYSGMILFPDNKPYPAVSFHVPDTSLPFARKEADAVHTLSGNSGIPCRILRGSESSPEYFLRDVEGAGIVHLSTHARADLHHPLRSVLGFSGSSTLSEGEIYRHTAGTPLLILNACETQKGPVDATEGMMSLAHAFLCRGAKQVIAGMWRIQDEEASRIMIDFYSALLKGIPVPQALQQAKINMIRQPETRFPRNWAAWQVLRP